MKNEIYYWSPFLGKIATERSVINSMIGLKRSKGKNFKINLINCYGEWDIYKTRLKKEKINVFDLQKKVSLKVDHYGFFFSRFIYFYTFLILDL